MATATESKVGRNGNRGVSAVEEWYTTKQAAAVIGVLPAAVTRMAQDGRISGIKVADGWLLNAEDVLRAASCPERLVGRPRSKKPQSQKPIRLASEEWLSVTDAAASADMTTGRIRQMLLAGEIRGMKVDNRWLVWAEDVAAVAGRPKHAKPRRKTASQVIDTPKKPGE